MESRPQPGEITLFQVARPAVEDSRDVVGIALGNELVRTGAHPTEHVLERRPCRVTRFITPVGKGKRHRRRCRNQQRR